MIKIFITTSDRYAHILPVFCYLFNKYWPEQEATILGYDVPQITLPDNFTFHSMGKQGDVSEWSTDLRRYFEAQPDQHVCWLMEDCFIKQPVNEDNMLMAYACMMPGVGRIGLNKDIVNRPHTVDNGMLLAAPDSRYRLSTQPSIWSKDFLLQYLTGGLTPWQFETQDAFDETWHVVGLQEPAIVCNEGVRRQDIYALDLNGMDEVDILEINKIMAKW